MSLQEEALPSPAAVQAAVRLIADEDGEVARACHSQLLRWGESSRAALRVAAEHPGPHMRVRARALICSLDLHVWVEKIRELAEGGQRREADGDFLLRGLMLICEFNRSGQAATGNLRCTLDDWSEELRPRVIGRSSLTAARHLANQLSGVEGFTGCRSGYYRTHNVFLDQVMQHRRGLPSTLAAVYIMVARGAGLRARPVRLPEYFLVRIHGNRPVLLDPFHGGRSVTKADCLRYLRGTDGGSAHSTQLIDMDDLDLLCGLLDDLRRAYTRPFEHEFRAALQRARRFLSA